MIANVYGTLPSHLRVVAQVDNGLVVVCCYHYQCRENIPRVGTFEPSNMGKAEFINALDAVVTEHLHPKKQIGGVEFEEHEDTSYVEMACR